MKMRMDKHNFMLKVLILIERFKVLKLIYSVSFNHSHDSNSQKQIMNFLYLHGKIFKLLKIFLKAGKFFKHPHHFIQYQYIHKKEDHLNVILEIFYWNLKKRTVQTKNIGWPKIKYQIKVIMLWGIPEFKLQY